MIGTRSYNEPCYEEQYELCYPEQHVKPSNKRVRGRERRNESVAAMSICASRMVSPDLHLFLSLAADVGMVVPPANSSMGPPWSSAEEPVQDERPLGDVVRRYSPG